MAASMVAYLAISIERLAPVSRLCPAKLSNVLAPLLATAVISTAAPRKSLAAGLELFYLGGGELITRNLADVANEETTLLCHTLASCLRNLLDTGELCTQRVLLGPAVSYTAFLGVRNGHFPLTTLPSEPKLPASTGIQKASAK